MQEIAFGFALGFVAGVALVCAALTVVVRMVLRRERSARGSG